MGLIIKPGEVITQASETISSMQDETAVLHQTLPHVTSFVNSTELEGTAWSSVKNQLSNHTAVIQGLICANEQMVSDSETLKSNVGYEDLVEDDIIAGIEVQEGIIKKCNDNIDKYNEIITSCSNMSFIADAMSFYISYLQTQVCINEDRIYLAECFKAIMESKLDDMYDIESITADLYTTAEDLYNSANQGLNVINAAWTGSGFSIIGDTSWRKKLDDAWDKRMEGIKAKVFNKDGTLKESYLREVSNKSIEDMTPAELDAYNMMVERIVAGDITDKELTMIIDNYYYKLDDDKRLRKDTALELAVYVDLYTSGLASVGLASEKAMQRSVLLCSIFSNDEVHSIGKVKYDKKGNYTLEYKAIRRYDGRIDSIEYLPEKRTITVGAVGLADLALSKADSESDTLLGNLLGFTKTIEDCSLETIVNEATKMVLEKVFEKNVGETASKALSSTLAGVGIIMGIAKDYNTAKTAEEIVKIDDCGTALSALKLYYSSAVDGGVDSYTSKVYPSEHTNNLINEYNKYLSPENKITLDMTINNPNKAAKNLESLGNNLLSIREKTVKKLEEEGKWVNIE